MYKNTTPENFQDCLTALMEQRGLSASHLAELLGYKSKTTLLRGMISAVSKGRSGYAASCGPLPACGAGVLSGCVNGGIPLGASYYIHKPLG